MKVRTYFGRGHHVLARVLVTGALLGASAIVGLATDAGAAAATHMIVFQPPSTTATDGVVLAQQPIIQLLDGSNAVDTASSDHITATITSGGVSATSNTAIASSGVATFSGLTLNALAGPYTLTFTDTTTGSIPAVVWGTVTVSAGSASQLAITTQPSSGAETGVALVRQPVVKVEDSGGNVITSVTTGSATASIHTGAGTVSGATTAAFVAGVATFAGLIVNGTSATANTLQFVGATFTSVASSTITMSSAATKLAITTAPSVSAGNGVALATQPVVTVEDVTGNPVVSDASTVTATVNQGGTLTNATALVVNGVATFSGLAINALAGTGYTLTFTDTNGSLTAAVSAAITVTSGAATKLVVTTEPSSSSASGVALAAQPVVKAEDSSGNVVTSVTTGNVTATINTGAGGSVSAGPTAAFVAGVATFAGLTITGVSGSSYTLLFTGDSLTVVDATAIFIKTAQAALTVTSVQGFYGRSVGLTSAGGSGTGAVTFALSGGTATGCLISGTTLTYSSIGTCLVTATKASDATYLSASSVAATVVVIYLPVPGPVRVTFAHNSSTLTSAGKIALTALAKKLTSHSVVSVIGYAKGNPALANLRAHAALHFLYGKVRVKGQIHSDRNSSLSAARVVTIAQ
jgi:hypothetical protein